jgi:serine/threonine protein kinase
VQETDKYEDQRLRHLLERTSIDTSRLEIVESIAEGGQAHVYLAKYTQWQCGWKRDVVVKRYKRRLGVPAVHELQRRILDINRRRKYSYLCRLIGLSQDDITGEVSVVMEAHQGDLRNLIDKRMEYLKAGMRWNMEDDDARQILMRSNMQDDDAIRMMTMPFPYKKTLAMMTQIARGMDNLCKFGIIHRDLKASNIFVSPAELEKNGRMRIHKSRKVELKEVFPYDDFSVYVGDYESSDGVVGTGFWRPPEVLKAVKEDIRPTYTPAADVYGFGIVCYELLTGHIPFQCEDVRRTDYDAVLSGRRPKLPDYLSPRMIRLLLNCWHHDPCQRPTWDEIRETVYVERSVLWGELDGTKLEE